MFKLKIQGVPNTLSEEDFLRLGEASELYSGSDIKTVSKEALFMPIRKCQNATKFKKLPDGYFTPCKPSDPEGVEMSMYSVPDGKLREPPVSFDDYMQALTRIRPSVCIEDLEKYKDFTNKFGQDG
jgi:vacuolar protein-sorting-associated protein 4